MFGLLSTLRNTHHHNANDQETWEGDDLLWGPSTHQVTWPFNYVVLLDHMTN